MAALFEISGKLGDILLELAAIGQLLEMDEETKKKVERRAQEILDEDPRARTARIRRMLVKRLAYHEIRAEERRDSEAQS